MKRILVIAVVFLFAGMLVVSSEGEARKKLVQDGIVYEINKDGKSLTLLGEKIGFHRSETVFHVKSRIEIGGKTYRVTKIGSKNGSNKRNVFGIDAEELYVDEGILEINKVSSIGAKKLYLPSTLKKIACSPMDSYEDWNEIHISGKNPYFHVENNILYSKDKKRLICVGEAKSKLKIANGVKEIAPFAFSGLTDIDTIELPESVTQIEEYAFWWAEVKKMVFGKKVKKVASTAFCRTEELRKLVISKKNPYIRTIDGALYSKDGKRLISSAAATESFVVPKRTTKISKGAISYQWKLKAVCILGNITRLPDECFQNSGIINVVLPNKLKTVGRRCFANCTDLEELNFPNTLQTLETGALEYCGFRKLKLPKSVDCIEEDALHCSVETLIFKGKVPPLLDTQKEIPYPEHGDDDGYDGDPYEWIAPGIGKVIVPKQSLKAYRKALKKRMVYEVLKGTK